MRALSPRVRVQLSIVLSDKSTKSASVQEANITAMVNGMQRYLELSVREGEEENDPVPIMGMNQLTITGFAVACNTSI